MKSLSGVRSVQRRHISRVSALIREAANVAKAAHTEIRRAGKRKGIMEPKDFQELNKKLKAIASAAESASIALRQV